MIRIISYILIIISTVGLTKGPWNATSNLDFNIWSYIIIFLCGIGLSLWDYIEDI